MCVCVCVSVNAHGLFSGSREQNNRVRVDLARPKKVSKKCADPRL